MSITNHVHTRTHIHVGSGGRRTGSERVMKTGTRDTGRHLLRDSSRVFVRNGIERIRVSYVSNTKNASMITMCSFLNRQIQ